MRTRSIRLSGAAVSLSALALLTFAATAAHTQARYTITGLYGLGLDPNGHVNSRVGALNNRGQIGGSSFVYSASHTYKGIDAFFCDGGPLKDLGNLGANTYNGFSNTFVTGINDAGQMVGYTSVYDFMLVHNELRGFRVPAGGALTALTPLTDFGSAGNGDVSIQPNGINNTGILVGQAKFYDTNHNFQGTLPFRYDPATNTVTRLPTNGTDGTRGFGAAFAINDVGQVVGFSSVYDSGHNYKGEAAFVYSNNAVSFLGNLGTDSNGVGSSAATAINSLGQVVGSSNVFGLSHTYFGTRAVLFNNGNPTSLGSLGTDAQGGGTSSANGINDRGQIVGYSYVFVNGVYQSQSAFLYRNGLMQDLNDLIPPGSGWHLQEATGINKRGQIVGNGTHNGATEAFLLTPYAAGDFNLDGNPDLLSQNATTGDVGLSLLSGTSRLLTQTVANNIAPGWRIGAVCDVNGDGYTDIIWQNTTNGNVLAWLLNNGAFARAVYLAYGVPTNYKLVGNGDFNGDGYPDLLWQNTTTGSVAVWYLAGTVIYDAATLTNGLGTGWNLTGIADIDSDGKPDLLWRNTTSGDLYVWLMDGTTLKTNGSKKITTLPSVWQLVATGDYNADGQDDLIWQNTSTGAVAAWLMSGTTVTSAVNVASGFGAGWNVIGPR